MSGKMSGANSFGSRLIVTSFGESHGAALGVVIDGVPAGINWDEALLVRELSRRRPGSSTIVSSRNETDVPEILSGVYLGKTLGTPIAVIVRNHDQRPQDYEGISANPRPGHADDVWQQKFAHVDLRGGGRASGRETLARVIGGVVARMLLAAVVPQLRVVGFARSIGPFSLSDEELAAVSEGSVLAEGFTARFPSASQRSEVDDLLLTAKREGKSYGGTAELRILGVPAGLGQPVFHKLKADLAAALIGVGSAVSIEFGAGLSATGAEGSEFHRQSGQAHYGGIRGGISTGERIDLRIGFKPTSTVLDIAKQGRHDPCIVPRAIPVMESMVFLVLADHLLWAQTDQISKLK
jgi:chorismate synthase